MFTVQNVNSTSNQNVVNEINFKSNFMYRLELFIIRLWV